MKLEDIGYENVGHLMDSTFHSNVLGKTLIASSTAATLGYYTEAYLGIQGVVFIGIFILFCLELFTGIKASFKEGNDFDSKKFNGAWIKITIYLIMIGVSHLMYIGIKPINIQGFEVNIYKWMHYMFLNFTIVNLFISNIENFSRLGWSEFVPGLTRLNSFLKIKSKQKVDEEEV